MHRPHTHPGSLRTQGSPGNTGDFFEVVGCVFSAPQGSVKQRRPCNLHVDQISSATVSRRAAVVVEGRCPNTASAGDKGLELVLLVLWATSVSRQRLRRTRRLPSIWSRDTHRWMRLARSLRRSPRSVAPLHKVLRHRCEIHWPRVWEEAGATGSNGMHTHRPSHALAFRANPAQCLVAAGMGCRGPLHLAPAGLR